MKKSIWFLISLLFVFNETAFTQVSYEGPAAGSIPSGVVVNTNDYVSAKGVSSGVPKYKVFNHYYPGLYPDNLNPYPEVAPEGSNYIATNAMRRSSADSLIEFSDFEGIGMVGDFQGYLHIPPDTYLAVGPNHIVQVVNTEFRITDKAGNEIKSIWADQFYASLGLSNLGSFDPKIIYDQFDKRWVMVWLQVDDANSEAYYLISVSDDEDPTGIWFNWALPSNTNGNTITTNWSDYQGVGFDQQAIYITGRQFAFGGSKQYEKIRIIPKSDLYVDSNPGTVTWKDIWNITYPGTSTGPDGIRPARMHSASSDMYFAIDSPFNTGTSFAIYTLKNPLSDTPTLEGQAVSVTSYYSPADPEQLGGGTPKIDGGGRRLRNEPFFRDGVLHLVHAVKNGTKSAINYLAIEASTYNLLKDITFGDPDYYYTYPAVAVSGRNDVIVSFSRGNANTYMGAYYAMIPNGGIPSSDQPMMEGKGNYIVTFGGSRNRWGDYNGAWVDPSDENNFFVFAEYASALNEWGNWVKGVRTVPFADATINSSINALEYGEVEIPAESDPRSIVIKNYGEEVLSISNIQNSLPDIFKIQNNFSFPINLLAYDSVVVDIKYVPGINVGFHYDTLVVASNDAGNSEMKIALSGRGFKIVPALAGILYGVTAPSNASGSLISINSLNAEGTEIGNLEFQSVSSLTMTKDRKELVGMIAGAESTEIIRINAEAGDAHLLFVVPQILSAIAFDKNNRLLAVNSSKEVMEINSEGQVTVLSTLDIIPTTIFVNPLDSQVWVTSRTGLNSGVLHKINPNTGDRVEIAPINFSPTGICFDESGDMIAVYNNTTKLVVVDTLSGNFTEIGTVGFSRVKGIAVDGDIVTGIGSENGTSNLPNEFSLMQNHPNPFNPTTQIEFTLPASANVKLSIYNIVGELVTELINNDLSAGYHSIEFNASNFASGVYIYKIKAQAVDGKSFEASKKMILMK